MTNPTIGGISHIIKKKERERKIMWYTGIMATRGVKENYLEENFDVAFQKKYVNRRKRINSYIGCLVHENELKSLEDEFSGSDNIRWDLQPIEGMVNVVRIYCDGASFNNGQKDSSLDQYASFGGCIINNDGYIDIFRGGSVNWTNNQGELMGALMGIRNIQPVKDDIKTYLMLISDSQYVTKGVTEWLEGWIERGWKNNEGKPTANKEMWEMMLEELNREDVIITFKWVRGHNVSSGKEDSILNEECDKIAKLALQETMDNNGLFYHRCSLPFSNENPNLNIYSQLNN